MNRWLLGARPRTLPAAVVPVLVGTALAFHAGNADWLSALLCLIVALGLQVGVNYANDYSDGLRGADERRVGPQRLVASALAAPRQVLIAAAIAFGIAAVAGLILSLMVDPRLLLLGLACIAAAWFYTGGKRPYGYSGFGELAVFIFFGLVATVGTAYAQMERVPATALAAGTAVGFLAVALLAVNNLRDIPGDTVAGKRTLAVRLGDHDARRLYVCAITFPYVIALGLVWLRPFVALVYVTIPMAVSVCRPVLAGATGRDLIPVLGRTGRLQLVFGVLLAAGLALS